MDHVRFAEMVFQGTISKFTSLITNWLVMADGTGILSKGNC